LRPILALTMGDAAGIGPEICAKALSVEEIYEICRPLVVGDLGAMRMGTDVGRVRLELNPVEGVHDALFEWGAIDVLNLGNIDVEELIMGVPQAMAGRASVEYVVRAAEMAMAGDVDAVVTAPLNKEAMNMAGFHYAGHTELLAELSGTRDYVMMLLAGSLRVVHVTTHVPLREVPDLITRDRVLQIVSITPAIDDARKLGLDAEGPIPADTVYGKAAGGAYDIVVAMYHDQGHIPVKFAGFKWEADEGGWGSVSGVNVTVGLPFIRTSVDHGTAYGKAGRREGTANPESMMDAMRIAVRMVQARRKAGQRTP